ncbi:hypothetical protein LCGC14_1129900 [marine sediment metagenome]|uniref:Uncharacterized protein n=1 Tax=marine sediment metagenome TaxID=412755 RepID=A0A0F9PJN3_9ZZZZ
MMQMLLDGRFYLPTPSLPNWRKNVDKMKLHPPDYWLNELAESLEWSSRYQHGKRDVVATIQNEAIQVAIRTCIEAECEKCRRGIATWADNGPFVWHMDGGYAGYNGPIHENGSTLCHASALHTITPAAILAEQEKADAES